MHKKLLKSVLALALVFSVNISTMNCVTASAQTSIQEEEDYKIHIVNVEDGTETVSDLPDESDGIDFVSEPISPIFRLLYCKIIPYIRRWLCRLWNRCYDFYKSFGNCRTLSD